ncbi:MAG: DEAD/DEAH box helicase, partial [Parachlamydiaceae bacterium]
MRNEENLLLKWFKLKNWTLLPFQKEAWELILQGKSGLISLPTGAGKTYAAYLPALSKIQDSNGLGTKILYITPLKALAKDLEIALKRPIDDLKLPYRVEKRTGDTSFARKNKQKTHPPEILLTTPESLALMLTDSPIQRFHSIQYVIVDEWHELLGTKRGVLLEVCLAKLKHLNPQVQIWGLTATIGNLHEAAQACVGMDRTPTLITANMKREVILNAILPETIDKLPWAGHLGLHMVTLVLQELSLEHPTIIFTNTRSQAERWYQAILERKPEWKNFIGLHHSSIDLKTRESIEEGIKSGVLKMIVCTSSLDLGIDLPVVERVIQIGSPKSIARLIQRAGRSSHKPLTPCQISLVPTHALEVIELEGYHKALQSHSIEERVPLKKCYDVLLQHLMTCAIGGGFNKEALYKEIKTTVCFSDLTIGEFEECLQILTIGGKALDAYPEYKKLILKEGLYQVEDLLIIRQHRMQIGAITSDPYVTVKLLKGKTIGSIEESFLTHLTPGDSFLFAGRCLKLVQFRDMTAHVRLSNELPNLTAMWKGGRLPFSSSLGHIIRHH